MRDNNPPSTGVHVATPIILTKNIARSAVQTNAHYTEDSYNYGAARYFNDKANYPKGTPDDGKINVIRNVKGYGTVIARVDSEQEAIEAIEADSGRKVQVKGASRSRREQRAEGRIS